MAQSQQDVLDKHPAVPHDEAVITTPGRQPHQPIRAIDAPSLRILAISAGIVSLSLAVFMLIAEDLLDGGGLIPHDKAVLAWFVGTRTTALVEIAKIISLFGSFLALSVFAVLVAAVLFLRGTPLILAVSPLVALLVAGLTSTGAKALFGRPRPPVAVHATSVTLAAFPSGHATDAAACLFATSIVLALTVAKRRLEQGLYVAAGLAVAALVGLSRLVLGVHWLSDVVAGWALGLAISTIVVVASWCWFVRPVGSDSADWS